LIQHWINIDTIPPLPSPRGRLERKAAKDSSVKPLLPLWDAWVDTLELSPETKADHYEMIRRMIVKADAKTTDANWLIEATIAASTFNKRLGYLKSCGKWAVSEGKIPENPFERVKPRKTTKKEVKPFTVEEIQAIS
jgi:integrase